MNAYAYLLFVFLLLLLFREHAIADYLENSGYTNALEAFKQDAKIVSVSEQRLHFSAF